MQVFYYAPLWNTLYLIEVPVKETVEDRVDDGGAHSHQVADTEQDRGFLLVHVWVLEDDQFSFYVFKVWSWPAKNMKCIYRLSKIMIICPLFFSPIFLVTTCGFLSVLYMSYKNFTKFKWINQFEQEGIKKLADELVHPLNSVEFLYDMYRTLTYQLALSFSCIIYWSKWAYITKISFIYAFMSKEKSKRWF